ncbi:MAG: GUN4 domain-containing protein [Cyanobacteria bacterium P01_D01_bin.156]
MTSSGKPQPKQPASEQLADMVLKVVRTGGIAGGGIGAFWQLFLNSDIPKAIASLVIGAGLSYGAKLLMPVHKGNEKRAEQAGKAINEGIDQVFDQITNQVIAAATGFENKYLLCQAAECQAFRSEGMAQHDGIFIPLLTEVFVPLELDSSAMQAGFHSLMLDRNQTSQRELTIWTFLAQAQKTPTFRQLAILAWGGYGKTTLLRHIAFRYGTKQIPKGAPKFIPVLLILRQYKDLLAQDNPPDLPQFITDHHLPDLPGADNLKPPKDWALNLLKSGRALVMLDGFDEVGTDQRSNVAKWLTAQMRRYGQAVFLLTSRPKAYREQKAGARLQLSTSLWVRDFNELQRKQFVTRWYECQERYANAGRETPDVKKTADRASQNLLAQIESQQALKDLAKNPLLLNMIVTFHRRVPGAELPKRKVELYREICQLQLLDRPRARGVGPLMTQYNAQGILQQIAFAMMQRQWKRIDQKVLLQGLSQIIKQQDDQFSAKDFLKEVVQISELLVKQEDQYEFAHLSFQEYLAAAHIAQTRKEQVLYSQFDNDWWKPTILLYAGIVSPTQLMREAVNQGATDLAYQCLQETTKQVDASLAAELKTVKAVVVDARYANLETYLKNGEWEKADNETYRLMITTVGKEENQFFENEELLEFPCEELKTIDQLWVTHSKGKYGFSIQKKIYLSVGGVADGTYNDEAHKQFCDLVAWRKDGSYRFEDILMDGRGPHGHLPRPVVPRFWFIDLMGVLGGGVWFFLSLLSHRDL